MTTQNLWDAAKADLRGKFIGSSILPQQTRKTLNRQPNFTPKTTGRRRIRTTKKSNISRRKEILKI